MGLIGRARDLAASTADTRRRIQLTGAALVFEAACAMDDDEPDKAPRVAVAWGRLKSLVEAATDAT